MTPPIFTASIDLASTHRRIVFSLTLRRAAASAMVRYSVDMRGLWRTLVDMSSGQTSISAIRSSSLSPTTA